MSETGEQPQKRTYTSKVARRKYEDLGDGYVRAKGWENALLMKGHTIVVLGEELVSHPQGEKIGVVLNNPHEVRIHFGAGTVYPSAILRRSPYAGYELITALPNGTLGINRFDNHIAIVSGSYPDTHTSWQVQSAVTVETDGADMFIISKQTDDPGEIWMSFS
jgi:hypothetical protein